MNSPYIIFDGTNTAYRTAAVTELSTSDGIRTSVPFGVLRSIRYVIELFNPSDVVIVWDGGRDKTRCELCPGYKKSKKRVDNRNKFDYEDLIKQLKLTQKMLYCLGLKQIRLSGVEADDIIYHLTKMVNSQNVIIVSTDKDFYQLLDERVSIYSPIKGEMINDDNLHKYLAVMGITTPQQYLEFHILNGDKSDNIPGVPGVGEVTAAKLIENFGTVDNAIKMIGKKPGYFGNRETAITHPRSMKQLEINREMIDLSRCNKAIPSMLNSVNDTNVPDYKEFGLLIEKMHFSSMLRDINTWLLPFKKLAVRRKLSGI